MKTRIAISLLLIVITLQIIAMNSRVKVCSYPGSYYYGAMVRPIDCGYTLDLQNGRRNFRRFQCVTWIGR